VYLIQLLLPLRDNAGQAFAPALYHAVSRTLTEQFGGLTAYTRAPAEGLWKEGSGGATRDEVVVYEVMAETLDRDWWSDYRAQLEHLFAQNELVVRAQHIERL
jgi:hypothetical protein